ncbi:tellurite resistance protein TehA-like permease [Dysgonomonas hofstadii]|uniref:Tellurite resistance protein TehA-like permease n=1 Tax=Dysgonomonas hofstadii TaxID=637886 RepID=A0A840CIZ2_9BACT|nr:hypothetical protein [Dysgonomonas hofstadii]MBB4035306.1 tellurite resistance protein TehA-like permease [Dysgonomonas hofstadii]
MTDEYKKLRKKLLAIFWTNMILSVAALLILIYIKGILNLHNGGNVLFEQYSIIFSIIAIPGALKLFHSQSKKIELLEGEIFLKKYFNSYILRLLILDAVIILNLAGIYSFNSLNAVYMTLIIIFALAFCYPGKNAIQNKHNETKE